MMAGGIVRNAAISDAQAVDRCGNVNQKRMANALCAAARATRIWGRTNEV